jgi:hypothetical protein
MHPLPSRAHSLAGAGDRRRAGQGPGREDPVPVEALSPSAFLADSPRGPDCFLREPAPPAGPSGRRRR